MSANDKNTLYKLCEQAAKEQDPEKLPELAKEILRLTNPEGQQPPPERVWSQKAAIREKGKGTAVGTVPRNPRRDWGPRYLAADQLQSTQKQNGYM